MLARDILSWDILSGQRVDYSSELSRSFEHFNYYESVLNKHNAVMISFLWFILSRLHNSSVTPYDILVRANRVSLWMLWHNIALQCGTLLHQFIFDILYVCQTNKLNLLVDVLDCFDLELQTDDILSKTLSVGASLHQPSCTVRTNAHSLPLVHALGASPADQLIQPHRWRYLRLRLRFSSVRRVSSRHSDDSAQWRSHRQSGSAVR